MAKHSKRGGKEKKHRSAVAGRSREKIHQASSIIPETRELNSPENVQAAYTSVRDALAKRTITPDQAIQHIEKLVRNTMGDGKNPEIVFAGLKAIMLFLLHIPYYLTFHYPSESGQNGNEKKLDRLIEVTVNALTVLVKNNEKRSDTSTHTSFYEEIVKHLKETDKLDKSEVIDLHAVVQSMYAIFTLLQVQHTIGKEDFFRNPVASEEGVLEHVLTNTTPPDMTPMYYLHHETAVQPSLHRTENESQTSLFFYINDKFSEKVCPKIDEHLEGYYLNPPQGTERDSTRMMKRLAYHFGLSDSIGFYTNMVLNRYVRDSGNKEQRKCLDELQDGTTRIVNEIIRPVFGDIAGHLFVQLIKKPLNNVGVSIQDKNESPHLLTEDNMSLWSVADGIQPKQSLRYAPDHLCDINKTTVKPIRRLVEVLSLDRPINSDIEITRLLPELDDEQTVNLQEVSNSMGLDVSAATVALRNFNFTVGDVHVDVMLSNSHNDEQNLQPTIVTAASDDYLFHLMLNERYELVGLPSDLSQKQRNDIAIIHAMVVAHLHDQTTIQPVAQTSEAVAKEMPEQSSQPQQRRRRTHRSRKSPFIVFTNEPTKNNVQITEEQTSGTEEPVSHMRVEVRGHWRELSGAVVRESRQFAWNSLLEKRVLPSLTAEQIQTATAVLFSNDSTRSYDSINADTEVLCRQLMRSTPGKDPILPADFPIRDFIAAEREYYLNVLETEDNNVRQYYADVEQADQEGRPKSKVSKPDRLGIRLPMLHEEQDGQRHPAIGRRVTTDTTPGVVVPRRVRETQTYVSAHTSTVPLGHIGTVHRIPKGELVVRANTAVQAVERIIEKRNE